MDIQFLSLTIIPPCKHIVFAIIYIGPSPHNKVIHATSTNNEGERQAILEHSSGLLHSKELTFFFVWQFGIPLSAYHFPWRQELRKMTLR